MTYKLIDTIIEGVKKEFKCKIEDIVGIELFTEGDLKEA